MFVTRVLDRLRKLEVHRKLGDGRVLLLLLALNFALIVVGQLGMRCVRPDDGPRIVELELTFSPALFRSILLDWTTYKGDAVRNFWWGTAVFDSLFPLAYAAGLLSLYAWIAQLVGLPMRRLLVLAPWVAAALDIAVENAGMLWMTRFALGTSPSQMLGTLQNYSFSWPCVLAVSVAASVKFFLIALSLFVSGVALLNSEFGWVLKMCRFSSLSLLVGSLPILMLSQGQDIVHGLVDADTPMRIRALALLALVVWSTSVWYWGRVLLGVRFEPPPPTTEEQQARERRFTIWIPRALGTATLVLAALAFVGAMGRAEARRGLLALFAVTCLVLATLFYLFVSRWRRKHVPGLERDPPEPVTVVRTTHVEVDGSKTAPVVAAGRDLRTAWGNLPRGTRRVVLTSLATSFAFLLAFVFAPVPVGQWLGTLTVLYIAAANAVFLGSVAVFLGRLWKLPLVTLALLAAAVFSFWNDNHAVRVLHEAPTNRPELRAAFKAWLGARQAHWTSAEPLPVVLVAAEGGGLRAAYWAAAVLSRLQDRVPWSEGGHTSFASHVFAISGVSGGSLGAAVFASLVAENGGRPVDCPNVAAVDQHAGPFQKCADGALSANFLAPTLAKMLAPDFLQWFVPLPVGAFDRAKALEDSWADAYEDTLDRKAGSSAMNKPFEKVWQGPAGPVPALLLNAAHVESGRRVLHSHLRFTSEDIPDAYDFATAVGTDVALKTAAHDSARFAYVSPAGLLRSTEARPLGHLVDGGYFENSGAQTLLDVVRSLRESGSTIPFRFVVLYLCSSPNRCYGNGQAQPGKITRPRGTSNLEELFAPVRALLGSREARGSLALEHLQRQIGDGAFVEIGVCPDIERNQKKLLALGWQRSHESRAFLSGQLEAVCHDPRSQEIRNESRFRCLENILAGRPRDQLQGICPSTTGGPNP